MALLTSLKNQLLHRPYVRNLLNKRWSLSRDPQPITATLLTSITPCFYISGPSTITGSLLKNMETLLNLTTPQEPVPIITDTVDILPTSLNSHSFAVFHFSPGESLFSSKNSTILAALSAYKPDLFYSSAPQPTALNEHLVRSCSPRLSLSLGGALPKELSTITLPEELNLRIVFPFLAKGL